MPILHGAFAPWVTVVTERLKLPMVMGGLGHGSGEHAPNEFIVIEPKAGSRVAGLANMEKVLRRFPLCVCGDEVSET